MTAKNRDQLRNPTLGNRVWATFTFALRDLPPLKSLLRTSAPPVPDADPNINSVFNDPTLTPD